MSRFKLRKSWILPAAIGLALSASSVTAAPVLYHYSTAANPFGGGATVGLLGSSAFVSGTFLYDSEAPATSINSIGATVYSAYDASPTVILSSFMDLTGTVQGFGFSDIRGTTSVGNELAQIGSTAGPLDFVTLNAEGATLGLHLLGFDIGAYRLINVRMFWQEGQLGITDFLENENLPAVLPSFQGRMALDFVPVSDPGGPVNFNNTVFFDGLTVTTAPIPEPEIYAMLGAGLGLMGWVGRRRKQQAA